MEQLLNIEVFKGFLADLGNKLTIVINDPFFWTQFAVIAIVFVLARLMLTPLFLKTLAWLENRSERVQAFRAPISALRTVANPVAWLLLQWIAIAIVTSLGLPKQALVVVSSLLSAWIIIRFATMTIANQGVANVVSTIAWSIAALNIFNLLTPTMEILDSWAVTVGAVKVSPLTVIKVGLALWLSLWLANGISALVERRLERSSSLAPTMQVLTAKLVRLLLIVFAILASLSAVGIDLTALAVFGGALGVGLGFGLQKIFSNLVSGLILLMDKSIKPGDVIAINNTYGWINHLGGRYTSLITRDGIEHLIPNEEMITQRVENWSFSNNLVRLRIPVGISYKSDPRLAMRLCVEAALDVARVKKDPEPRCQLLGFGDSALNLELRVWIDDPTNGRGSVLNDVYLGIWDRFHQHNIEIPFPQSDVHIRTMPEEMIQQIKTEASRHNDGEAS